MKKAIYIIMISLIFFGLSCTSSPQEKPTKIQRENVQNETKSELNQIAEVKEKPLDSIGIKDLKKSEEKEPKTSKKDIKKEHKLTEVTKNIPADIPSKTPTKEQTKEKINNITTKPSAPSKNIVHIDEDFNPIVDKDEVIRTPTKDVEIEVEEDIEKPQTHNPPPRPITTQPTQSKPIESFNHNSFDLLLQKFVSHDGKVDYSAFKSRKSELENYLKLLAKNPPKDDWSDNKALAYWINLYNAGMINTVLDSYPIDSPMDLDNGATWKVKRIKSGDQLLSLDQIENQIIRPKFNDPRIHFAVNCAAKSCPKLYNYAFTEKNIQKLLNNLTQEFIQNSSLNTLSKKKIEISKIFEWYKADFGDIIRFINKYSNQKIDKNVKIEFKEYDWKLNDI